MAGGAMKMLVVALMMSSMLLFAGATGSSKMVADIVAWHKPSVPRTAQQLATVLFVDTSGHLVTHMVVPSSEQPVSDQELIEDCIPKGSASFTEQTRQNNLNWYDALSYSSQIVSPSKPMLSYDQLAEIQRRIVGGNASLSGLRDPSLRQDVLSFLEQLNSGLESVSRVASLERRIAESSKLAAWSMLTLKELHPFVDGNGRVMEVMNSMIMNSTGVTPFPFRVHTYFRGVAGIPHTSTSTRMMKGSGVVSGEEMSDYVIFKLWETWDHSQLCSPPSRYSQGSRLPFIGCCLFCPS